MEDPAQAAGMDAIIARFGEVQEAYEHLGGYTLEAQAREVLHGLGTLRLAHYFAADILQDRLIHMASRRVEQPALQAPLRIAECLRTVSLSHYNATLIQPHFVEAIHRSSVRTDNEPTIAKSIADRGAGC
jgi:hypothetical protein